MRGYVKVICTSNAPLQGHERPRQGHLEHYIASWLYPFRGRDERRKAQTRARRQAAELVECGYEKVRVTVCA